MQLDLAILVPGKDEEQTIDGLLACRSESLSIPPLRYKLLVHPRRDPGCLREARSLLQPFERIARRAIVLFDHEGSGAEDTEPGKIESEVERQLASAGWAGRQPPLRQWLVDHGWLSDQKDKPSRPKEALEAALYESKVMRSAAIYRTLAKRVSVRRCMDPAFERLKTTLKEWFGTGRS